MAANVFGDAINTVFQTASSATSTLRGALGGAGGGGGGARGNGDGGTGGKGLVVVSYGLPPVGPCFVVLDDGARSGNTIIEFTCSGVWQAPEGLIEFTVTSVGGGGGGGMGKAAGGGGAGGFAQETINVNATFGLPANSNFNVNVGQGGPGASDLSERGGKGRNYRDWDRGWGIKNYRTSRRWRRRRPD